MAQDVSSPNGVARSGWVVSPEFDLAFLANVFWPLAFLPWLVEGPAAPLTFWQLYFLTTPHRWITLFLVATDADRRDGRGWLFVTLAVISLLVVGGAYAITGSLLCIGFIDLIWNGWHFGSQHAGVLRMYSRKVGSRWLWIEKHGLRFFVLYIAIRTANWFSGMLHSHSQFQNILDVLDGVAFLVPITLLACQLPDLSRRHLGKLAYVLSTCCVYSGLLLALRAEHERLVMSFSIGSAIFHATEYLAIITHYAWRRREVGSAGAFRSMAIHWSWILATFVLIAGLMGLIIEPISSTLWIGMNLWGSFLHYAYDGLIWKLRRPATATALGVSA
jgi:hypothetical protein